MSHPDDEDEKAYELARLGLSPAAKIGNSLDDSNAAGGPTARAKRPWWVAGRSMRWSTIVGAGWLAMFVLQLVGTLAGGPAHGLDFVVMIGSGLLAVWYGASAAYLGRTRR